MLIEESSIKDFDESIIEKIEILISKIFAEKIFIYQI